MTTAQISSLYGNHSYLATANHIVHAPATRSRLANRACS